MIKKTHSIVTLNAAEAGIIVNLVESKYDLSTDCYLEENLENSLKDTLLSREVALYLNAHTTLEDNVFHIVELPIDNKLIEFSIGMVNPGPTAVRRLAYSKINK